MDLDALLHVLRELLRGRFGAGVEVRELRALAGDASTRSYARCTLAGPAAPSSVVIMVLADRGVAMSSEELGVVPDAGELPFMNVYRFLRRVEVDVPEVYVDASSRGVLVLEDIGDLTLRAAIEDAEPAAVEARFRGAIDQLLRLQIDGTRLHDPGCIAFRQAFDARVYEWEFEHFIEYGVERRYGPLPAAAAARLRDLFGAIAGVLDRAPRCLTHRDYHAWNLFVQGDRLRVIDFQDALMAAAPYDLATLLGDRDTTAVVPPDMEARLLDYYRAAWTARGGTPWDAASFVDLYWLCALQKALKVVGRFHYLDLVKKKPAYLGYLPPTFRQIGRVLDRLPEWAELGELLGACLPELRR